jgi:hypothetical protein
MSEDSTGVDSNAHRGRERHWWLPPTPGVLNPNVKEGFIQSGIGGNSLSSGTPWDNEEALRCSVVAPNPRYTKAWYCGLRSLLVGRLLLFLRTRGSGEVGKLPLPRND